MYKKDFELWLDYHKNPGNREYTEEEMKEIRASDFAMDLLVPTDSFLEYCGGIEKLKRSDIITLNITINKAAEYFKVPTEVIAVKVKELQKEEQEKKKTKGVR